MPLTAPSPPPEATSPTVADGVAWMSGKQVCLEEQPTPAADGTCGDCATATCNRLHGSWNWSPCDNDCPNNEPATSYDATSGKFTIHFKDAIFGQRIDFYVYDD